MRVLIKKYSATKLWLILGLAVFWPTNFAEASIGGWVSEIVYNFALAVGGLVLTIGSGILDATVLYLIVDMGNYFAPNAGLGAAVNLGWTLIRDVLNMCFIFGLIYIGIRTILNSEDSGTRRQLGYLIAAALLINFSLFITQLVVDFSNLLATQVYTQIVGDVKPSTSVTSALQSPISAAFLDAVGFSSVFSDEGIKIADLEFGKAMMFSLMMLVFFVVAGIAFAFGAVLIVTRFVALLLYMIFSPLMFMGWILPRFQNLATTWWNGFFKYAFFGPVYLFLIYISVHMLRGLVSGLTNGQTATQVTQETLAGGIGNSTMTVGYMQLVMYFVIMIGLLWASLKIGDKMSIAGGAMVTGGFRRAGGALSVGLAGRGLRNTVGWAANKYAESESAQRRARTGGVLSRQFMRTADSVRSASFDARNTAALKSAGLGKGQKGGYVQRGKDLVKREQDLAKLIGSEDTRFYEDAGVRGIYDAEQTYAKRRTDLVSTLSQTTDPQRRKDLTAEINSIDSLSKQRLGSEDGKKHKKIKDEMKKMIQNEYAANLEKREPMLNSTREAFKEAADSIRKETSKSKTDSAFDTLKAEFEKAGKDKSD